MIETIKRVLKKKTDFNDLKAILARNGELINYETVETGSEDKFGQKLINSGINVLTQFKVEEFTFDFKIFHYPILIEIDGEVHEELQRRQKDYIKDRYAQRMGYQVLRFSNQEVHTTLFIQEVQSAIRNCTRSPRELWLYPYTLKDQIRDFFHKKGLINKSTLDIHQENNYKFGITKKVKNEQEVK